MVQARFQKLNTLGAQKKLEPYDSLHNRWRADREDYRDQKGQHFQNAFEGKRLLSVTQ